MIRLNLSLSSQIEGQWTSPLPQPLPTAFAINRSFQICRLLLDGQAVPYTEQLGQDNWKLISIDPRSGSELAVCYKGVLDGSTGLYPYVREKTGDPFYLLRSETVWLPTFFLPNTEAYWDHLLNPQPEDSVRVTVTLTDERSFCTNLHPNPSGEPVGFEPTFAIGDYKQKQMDFGPIFYLNLSQQQQQQIEQLAKETEERMSFYKPARIRDFQLIAVPSGYGSFVLPGTIFADAATLADPIRLIHELIHTNWNPLCTLSCQRTRFFDEAITQYFTARLCDSAGIQSRPESIRQWKQEFRQIVSTLETPVSSLTDWGKTKQGDLAYSFGGLALFALEDAVGTAVMDQALQKMLCEFPSHRFDFSDFYALFPPCAHEVFRKYFETTEAALLLCTD